MWPDDPDGVAEPLANALRAALAVSGTPPRPPPVDPPSAPTLSATAGDGSVDLTWTAPADDGGAPVTAYEIHRGTSPGSVSLLATVDVQLSYTDATVTNGTTYWYEVAARNAAGVGERSNQVSATPQSAAVVPSAPVGLTAQKLRDGIRLSWSAPASDGGSAITGFRVHRSGGTGPVTFEVAGTQFSFVDGTVARRTWYSYAVTALNAVGEGPPSNQVSVKSR